jgi:hypothetical protein
MERNAGRLGLLLALAAGAAHAAPAHYVVFTRDASGAVEPVY